MAPTPARNVIRPGFSPPPAIPVPPRPAGIDPRQFSNPAAGQQYGGNFRAWQQYNKAAAAVQKGAVKADKAATKEEAAAAKETERAAQQDSYNQVLARGLEPDLDKTTNRYFPKADAATGLPKPAPFTTGKQPDVAGEGTVEVKRGPDGEMTVIHTKEGTYAKHPVRSDDYNIYHVKPGSELESPDTEVIPPEEGLRHPDPKVRYMAAQNLRNQRLADLANEKRDLIDQANDPKFMGVERQANKFRKSGLTTETATDPEQKDILEADDEHKALKKQIQDKTDEHLRIRTAPLADWTKEMLDKTADIARPTLDKQAETLRGNIAKRQAEVQTEQAALDERQARWEAANAAGVPHGDFEAHGRERAAIVNTREMLAAKTADVADQDKRAQQWQADRERELNETTDRRARVAESKKQAGDLAAELVDGSPNTPPAEAKAPTGPPPEVTPIGGNDVELKPVTTTRKAVKDSMVRRAVMALNPVTGTMQAARDAGQAADKDEVTKKMPSVSMADLNNPALAGKNVYLPTLTDTVKVGGAMTEDMSERRWNVAGGQPQSIPTSGVRKVGAISPPGTGPEQEVDTTLAREKLTAQMGDIGKTISKLYGSRDKETSALLPDFIKSLPSGTDEKTAREAAAKYVGMKSQEFNDAHAEEIRKADTDLEGMRRAAFMGLVPMNQVVAAYRQRGAEPKDVPNVEQWITQGGVKDAKGNWAPGTFYAGAQTPVLISQEERAQRIIKYRQEFGDQPLFNEEDFDKAAAENKDRIKGEINRLKSTGQKTGIIAQNVWDGFWKETAILRAGMNVATGDYATATEAMKTYKKLSDQISERGDVGGSELDSYFGLKGAKAAANLVPMFVETMLYAGVGAAIGTAAGGPGGTVAGGVEGIFAKSALKSMLRRYTAKYVADGMVADAAEARAVSYLTRGLITEAKQGGKGVLTKELRDITGQRVAKVGVFAAMDRQTTSGFLEGSLGTMSEQEMQDHPDKVNRAVASSFVLGGLMAGAFAAEGSMAKAAGNMLGHSPEELKLLVANAGKEWSKELGGTVTKQGALGFTQGTMSVMNQRFTNGQSLTAPLTDTERNSIIESMVSMAALGTGMHLAGQAVGQTFQKLRGVGDMARAWKDGVKVEAEAKRTSNVEQNTPPSDFGAHPAMEAVNAHIDALDEARLTAMKAGKYTEASGHAADQMTALKVKRTMIERQAETGGKVEEEIAAAPAEVQPMLQGVASVLKGEDPALMTEEELGALGLKRGAGSDKVTRTPGSPVDQLPDGRWIVTDAGMRATAEHAPTLAEFSPVPEKEARQQAAENPTPQKENTGVKKETVEAEKENAGASESRTFGTKAEARAFLNQKKAEGPLDMEKTVSSKGQHTVTFRRAKPAEGNAVTEPIENKPVAAAVEKAEPGAEKGTAVTRFPAPKATSGPSLIAESGHSINLPRRRVTFGVGVGVDVPLIEGKGINPVHFEIQPDAEGHKIRDVSGGAGLEVNGKTVKEATLKHGDVVTAGELRFGYWNKETSSDEQPPAPAAKPEGKAGEAAPMGGKAKAPAESLPEFRVPVADGEPVTVRAKDPADAAKQVRKAGKKTTGKPEPVGAKNAQTEQPAENQQPAETGNPISGKTAPTVKDIVKDSTDQLTNGGKKPLTREEANQLNRVHGAMARFLPAFRQVFDGLRWTKEKLDSGGLQLDRDNHLVLSLPDLASAMEKAKNPREWALGVLSEEAVHSVTLDLIRNGKIDPVKLLADIKEEAPKTYEKIVAAYRRVGTPEENKALEFIRMVVQKRIKITADGITVDGALTEEHFSDRVIAHIKTILEAVVNVIRKLADNLPGRYAEETSRQADEIAAALAESLTGAKVETKGERKPAKAEEAPKTPKSSTQFALSKPDAKPLLDFAKSIPDDEVYHKNDESGKEDYGIETEPHVTALYGLTKHDPEPIKAALEGHGPVSFTLGKMSVFDNPDYDVLKVSVSGADIHAVNKKLKALPNENTFPDYQPHLTLAYLKKGEGAKYVGDSRFEGKKLAFDSLTFSPPNEIRKTTGTTEIPLSKTKAGAPSGAPAADARKGHLAYAESLRAKIEKRFIDADESLPTRDNEESARDYLRGELGDDPTDEQVKRQIEISTVAEQNAVDEMLREDRDKIDSEVYHKTAERVLEEEGFRLEGASNKSSATYWSRPDSPERIRISDHEPAYQSSADAFQVRTDEMRSDDDAIDDTLAAIKRVEKYETEKGAATPKEIAAPSDASAPGPIPREGAPAALTETPGNVENVKGEKTAERPFLKTGDNVDKEHPENTWIVDGGVRRKIASMSEEFAVLGGTGKRLRDDWLSDETARLQGLYDDAKARQIRSQQKIYGDQLAASKRADEQRAREIYREAVVAKESTPENLTEGPTPYEKSDQPPVAEASPETRENPPAASQNPEWFNQPEETNRNLDERGRLPDEPSGVLTEAMKDQARALGHEEAPRLPKWAENAVADEVKDRLARNPMAAEELKDSAEKNPRALNPVDTLMLTNEAVRLRNDYNARAERIHDPETSESERAELEARQAKADAEMERMERIAALNTSASGSSLRAIQMMMAKDYSLAGMMAQFRKGGKPMTEADKAMVTRLHGELAPLTAAREAHEKNAAPPDIDHYFKLFTEAFDKAKAEGERVQKEAGRSAKKVISSLKKGRDEALTRLRQKMGKDMPSAPVSSQSMGEDFDPDTMFDLARVLAYHMADAGKKATLEELQNRLAADVGEWSRAHFDKIERVAREIHSADTRQPTASDILERMKSSSEELPSVSDVGALARAKLAEGMKGRENIMKAIHADLIQQFPDITERQVRDQFTAYGKQIFPSQESLEIELRDMKELVRLDSQIEDLQKGLPGWKSGLVHDPDSPEVSALRKKANALRKKYGIEATDPKTELAGPLAGVKNRLRHDIAELNRQKDAGGRTLEEREREGDPVKYDEETKALLAERNQLKKELAEVEHRAGITLEERTKAAEKALDRQIENLDRRIFSGDHTPASRPEIPDNSNLVTKRAIVAAQREHLRELREAAVTPSDRAARALDVASRLRDRYERILTGEEHPVPRGTNVPQSDAEVDVRGEIETLKRAVSDMRRTADAGNHAEAAKLDALERSIAEYERVAAGGDEIARGRKVGPESQAVHDAIVRRDAAKKVVDALKRYSGAEEAAKVSRIEAAADRVKAQIAMGRILPKDPVSGADHPSVAAARAKLARINADLDAARKASPAFQARSDENRLAAQKNATLARIKALRDRIVRRDFAPAPKKAPLTDPELDKIKVKEAAVKLEFEREKEKARLMDRTAFQKIADAAAAWKRTAVLLSATVYGKLGAAAGEGIGITATEDAVGHALAQLPGIRDIAKGAPRHGAFVPKAQIGAVTALWSHMFKDIAQIWKTGKMDIDLLHGKEKVYVDKGLGAFVGRTHYMLKSPAKRAEFIRAMGTLEAYYERNGMAPAEIREPLFQGKMAAEAYLSSNSSIFQDDNWLTDVYKGGMARLAARIEHLRKDGNKVGADGLKLLEGLVKFHLPVVRIPTNVVFRTFEYLGGAPLAGMRVAAHLINSTGEMTPKQKDLIMRNLKRGAVGLALFALGFFNPKAVGGYYMPGKQPGDDDPEYGGLKIGGVNIWRMFLHNPALECLQFGATFRHMIDSRVNRKSDETHTTGEALTTAIGGLMEEIPFVNEAKRLVEAGRDPDKSLIGEDLKSAVPGIVQQAARLTDRKGMDDKPVIRHPKGWAETVETGIPGLRQNVPTFGQRWARDNGIDEKEPYARALATYNASRRPGRFEEGGRWVPPVVESTMKIDKKEHALTPELKKEFRAIVNEITSRRLAGRISEEEANTPTLATMKRIEEAFSDARESARDRVRSRVAQLPAAQ